ncbi:CFA/I fimbrial subunit C precursor [Vibrio sp. JCM 19236]|nr:CFA/I fimbrial subunit C precursor [Vibrio sp. JCM 19236]
MNYQELDLVTDNELMAALYGTENSQQWSANYGIDLFDGLVNMYVNDSVRERDNREYRNLTSSLTYSRTIFRNTEFSMTYSRSINENSEDYHIEDNYIENILSMSVSIPLENDSAYTGNFQTSDRSGSTLIQTLSNDALMENEFIVVDGSVTSTLNGVDSSFGLSSNYLFSNGKYQSDGYFSYDSNQEKLANINLSTTLVSDWKNLYFTDDTDSESYIIVKNTGDDEAASRVETGQVVLRSDNSTRAVPVYNEDTLITVPEYTTYQYSVDNEVSGYSSAKQNRGTDFSFPGTLNVIENKTQKVISFMTYFENMNEDSLNDIECLGDGCVNISRIGDGIYSVTVYEDTDYKIVSNGEYCLVSRDDLNYYQGKSRCFPKVIDDPMSGLEIVKLGDENEEVTYVYLGKLNKDVPKYLESKLSNEGMKLVKYEFGKDNEFLFISVPRNKLNELELYVNSSVWSEIEKYATQSYDFEGYSYVY